MKTRYRSRAFATLRNRTGFPLRGARAGLLNTLARLGSNNPSVPSDGPLRSASFGSALNRINRVRLSSGLLNALTALLGLGLSLANLGYPAATLHGSLPQRERLLSRSRASGGFFLGSATLDFTLGDNGTVFLGAARSLSLDFAGFCF